LFDENENENTGTVMMEDVRGKMEEDFEGRW